jgi:methyl coenzyme M reductase subunit C-like uncharacterized protein (methanogenesis marker protein 7)
MELDTISSMFEDSLYKFEDETKETPQEISNKIEKLEYQISMLQAAQKYYNTNIIIEIDGVHQPLQAVINYVGGLSRLSKKWRDAAKTEKRRSLYGLSDKLKRNKDEEVAKATISKQDALTTFKHIEKHVLKLRSIISESNNKMVEISFIDESLFD